MKKVSSILTIATLAAFTNISFANAYVGINAIYNKTGLKKDYGGNFLSTKAAPGLNMLVGYMFNKHFGTELGFEIDKTMKRTATNNANTLLAGRPIGPLLGSVTTSSNFKQNNFYLGILGKYEINNNLFTSLMIGGALSKFTMNYTIISNGNNIAGVNGTNRNFSKTKLIPLIKANLGYKITNNIYFNASASWRNTYNITIKAKEPGSESIIKLKNTFNIGLGAIFLF